MITHKEKQLFQAFSTIVFAVLNNYKKQIASEMKTNNTNFIKGGSLSDPFKSVMVRIVGDIQKKQTKIIPDFISNSAVGFQSIGFCPLRLLVVRKNQNNYFIEFTTVDQDDLDFTPFNMMDLEKEHLSTPIPFDEIQQTLPKIYEDWLIHKLTKTKYWIGLSQEYTKQREQQLRIQQLEDEFPEIKGTF